MSKRFTETEKWRDAWFRQLKPVHKCLWQYLVDNCDQAGVIDVDWDLASFQIGARVSAADLSHFGRQVTQLENGKTWIVKFILFQYGRLSRDCKPHNPVFAAIERHGITEEQINGETERVSKPLESLSNPLSEVSKGFQSLQEKDKDKDKDKETEASGPTVVSPETIYEAYPRKVAKQDALKAISRAMQAVPAIRLLERTQSFAAAVARWGPDDRTFIPHPATWFNRGSYDDDPTTWERRNNGSATNRPSTSRGFEQQNDYSGVNDK
jgi:hypothetical protein